jgi:hypothetical protein
MALAAWQDIINSHVDTAEADTARCNRKFNRNIFNAIGIDSAIISFHHGIFCLFVLPKVKNRSGHHWPNDLADSEIICIMR